jgi:hypothetical protein
MLMSAPRRRWRPGEHRTIRRRTIRRGRRRPRLIMKFGLSMGYPPGFAIMESRRTPPVDRDNDLAPWRLDGPELQRLQGRCEE